MSLKQNLLKKIQIDALADNVLRSLTPQDYGSKVDKDSMRRLLEICNYGYEKRRDLDLYVKTNASGVKRVLVLDNELPVYNTDIDDVVLRKSPTIKEMLNIRNAIKILCDSNVVVSKKAESLKIIQKECIDTLVLTFEAADLEALAKDGIIALKIEDADGVMETLSLFAELLGFRPPPHRFGIEAYKAIGHLGTAENGSLTVGPLIIYNPSNNSLKYIDGPICGSNKQSMEHMQNVVTGKEKPSGEGEFVFQHLKEAALKKFF